VGQSEAAPTSTLLLAIVIARGACGRTELDQGAPLISIGTAAGASGAAGGGHGPSAPAMDAAPTADADAGETGGVGTGGSAGATINERLRHQQNELLKGAAPSRASCAFFLSRYDPTFGSDAVLFSEDHRSVEEVIDPGLRVHRRSDRL
jgi:hypothetical protein